MGSSSGKLSTDDLNYLLANTNFDKPTIQQWFKGFKRDCPSGKLSKSKFIEVYSQLYPAGDPREFCEHAFRSFDKDNSGTIDFREFLVSVNVMSNGTPQQKLNWAFELVDVDGNGTADRDEVNQIISATFKLVGDNMNVSMTPEQVVDEIFRKMDDNNDGVLTKNEFVTGCSSDPNMMKMLTGSSAAA